MKAFSRQTILTGRRGWRSSRIAALLGLTVGLGLAQGALANTFLRVNQVGYASGQAARAYVMTTSSVTSESFQVVDSHNTVVSSGTVGSTTGTWGSYHVYPIDFTVSGSGTYTIKALGSVTATSPAFAITAANALYSKALANTLSFYQVQRDGPNFVSSALRTAPAHLNDAHATVYFTPPDDGNDTYTDDLNPNGQTIDASGGWVDAGDYVKFVETTSYALGVMLTGIRDFPNQMGAGSVTSNFTAEAQFGLNWMLKMWNDSSRTLYYQVGIGIDFDSSDILSDHDFWRLPQADDNATPTSAPGFAGVSQEQLTYITHRPVLVAGAAGARISPNLAGRIAADFALCYQVFHKTNSALANQCLTAAEHVYALADTAPSGNLLTASPFDFYPESVWADDMEWGATELNLALRLGGLPAGLPQTNPAFYLTAAANWANTYIGNGNLDSLNLYDVAGLAHFDLSRAMTAAGNPQLAVSQSTLLSNLNTQLHANAPSSDPFDTIFTWKKGDSASHTIGLSVMASEIANLSSNATNVTVANHQAANVLGANAWGVSFIVGDGSTFPDCPQHQIANLTGSLNGTGAILAGAVVEGPNAKGSSGSQTAMKACGGTSTYSAFNGNGAVFTDWVQSYATDEPAIDLSATSMLMFAWRMAGAPAAVQ